MTDRELLEAAAKAAGINLYVWGTEGAENFANMDAPSGNRNWNPLTDDGDALRLAVKLQIRLEFTGGLLALVWPSGFSEDARNHRLDMFAATRRAIVRAAASLAATGNALCKGVPRFSTDIALTPHAPAQAQIDALRIENERLRRERDALHAENDRLQSAFVDINLEVGRLKRERDDARAKLQGYALQALVDDAQEMGLYDAHLHIAGRKGSRP